MYLPKTNGCSLRWQIDIAGVLESGGKEPQHDFGHQHTHPPLTKVVLEKLPRQALETNHITLLVTEHLDQSFGSRTFSRLYECVVPSGEIINNLGNAHQGQNPFL